MNWAEKLHHAAVAKVNSSDLPHGECECRNGCGCANRPGPAAFTVVREGKAMKVCTRCDFSSDSDTRKPLPARTDNLDVYVEYDALGALCLFPPDEESEVAS